VTIEGKEQWPLTDAQLRQAAIEGRLQPNDQVRREGMSAPVVAAKIRGLFTTESTPSNPASADAAAPGAAKSPAPSALRDAADRIARAAALKKLQLHDLPEADFLIGRRAYEESLGGETLREAFADIQQLEREVEAKKLPDLAPPQETLADRTKRLASEAKKRVDVELLLKRRKQLLSEIGGRIRQDAANPLWSPLSAEIQAASQTAEKLASLQAEDQASGGSRMLKRRLLQGALIATLLIAAGLFLYDAVTTSPEELHAANLVRIEADKKSRQEALEAEKAEERRQYEEERLADEAKSQELQAKRQAEEQQRQLETEAAERKRRLEQEQEELEKAREQAETAARKRQEEQERQQREHADAERNQRKAEEDAKAAQTARRQLAESLFSTVRLDPSANVQLAASVRKLNASVELKSPDLNRLNELLAAKDWLGLINHLQNAEHTEYPDESLIQNAYQSLTTGDYWLLVRTDRPNLMNESGGPQLLRILLPLPSEEIILDYDHFSLADISYDWQLHPDGIGYLTRWTPTGGRSIVIIANRRELYNALGPITDQLNAQCAAIRKKIELGEVDSTTGRTQIRELLEKAQDRVEAGLLKR
jgi:murein DD-endopeptidase MepM/ murein hydrolase activator NlpD